jgi:hypothetical protein
MGATGFLDWTGGFVDLGNGDTKYMDNKITSTDITRPYLGKSYYIMLFYILIFTSYDLTSVVVKHPNVLANGN